METILRHWTLLRVIPRAPRNTDPRSLRDHLERKGLEVCKRKPGCGLVKRSTIFPVAKDEASTSGGPRVGFLPPNPAGFRDPPFCGDRPCADPRALASPGRCRAPQLSPEAGPGAWPDRVRVLQRTIDLHAPDVIEYVYQALLEGRRLQGDYTTFRSKARS